MIPPASKATSSPAATRVPTVSQLARTRVRIVIGVPTTVPSAASSSMDRSTSPLPTALIGTRTVVCPWAGTVTVTS